MVFDVEGVKIDDQKLKRVEGSLISGIDSTSGDARVRAIGRVLEVKKAQDYITTKIDRRTTYDAGNNNDQDQDDDTVSTADGDLEGNALKRFAMKLNKLVVDATKGFNKRR